MMKPILTTAGALLLMAAPAMAVPSWDVDGDGALGAQEFVAGFSSMATFSSFDADGNGLLDEAEWSNGLTPVGDYANMDLNGDGGVDEGEYNALLFNRYDTDGTGTIDTTEMAAIEADLAEDGLLAR